MLNIVRWCIGSFHALRLLRDMVREDEPFLAASKRGDADVLREWIERDPGVATRATGHTALGNAIRHGCVEATGVLLDAGAHLMWPGYELVDAASEGTPEVVLMLLERGYSADQMGPDGRSALMVAARCGRVPMLRLLVDHGADPLQRDPDGRTAKDHAAARGQQEAVALLEAAEHLAAPARNETACD